MDIEINSARSIPNFKGILYPELDYTKVPVSDLSLHQFSEKSAAGELYQRSLQRGFLSEGNDAIGDVLRLSEWYRQKKIERITPDAMISRLAKMRDWAEMLFSKPEFACDIEAVAFHGTSLRGNPEARDVDIKIFTTYEPESPMSDHQYGCLNATEERVGKSVAQSMPLTLDGLPINKQEIFVHSFFHSKYGWGADLIESGPWIMFVKTAHPLGVVFDWGGVDFLDRADKPNRF